MEFDFTAGNNTAIIDWDSVCRMDITFIFIYSQFKVIRDSLNKSHISVWGNKRKRLWTPWEACCWEERGNMDPVIFLAKQHNRDFNFFNAIRKLIIKSWLCCHPSLLASPGYCDVCLLIEWTREVVIPHVQQTPYAGATRKGRFYRCSYALKMLQHFYLSSENNCCVRKQWLTSILGILKRSIIFLSGPWAASIQHMQVLYKTSSLAHFLRQISTIREKSEHLDLVLE